MNAGTTSGVNLMAFAYEWALRRQAAKVDKSPCVVIYALTVIPSVGVPLWESVRFAQR